MTTPATLASIIDAAFDERMKFTPGTPGRRVGRVDQASPAGLGRARVAEKRDGRWW